MHAAAVQCHFHHGPFTKGKCIQPPWTLTITGLFQPPRYARLPMLPAMETPSFPASDVLFSPNPTPFLLHSFFLLLFQHCSGLRKVAPALWFRAPTGCALLKLRLVLDGHEVTQLHHSSQQTMQIQNRTHVASLHCNQHSCVPLGTSLDREGRKMPNPTHAWEKHVSSFLSVDHTHHLLVLLAFHSAVPMTLVHLALNLYSENTMKSKQNQNKRTKCSKIS